MARGRNLPQDIAGSWATRRRTVWVMRKPAAMVPVRKHHPCSNKQGCSKGMGLKSAQVGVSLLVMARAVEFILRAMVQSKETMGADFYWKDFSRGCLRNR